jgi:hypothetical protein
MRKPHDLTQFLRFVEMCYEFWGSVVTLCPPGADAKSRDTGAATQI